MTISSDTTQNACSTKNSGPGLVVICPSKDRGRSSHHETATRLSIARRFAALKGYEFGGEYDSAVKNANACYLVPADTLVGIEDARSLGITNEADFFGGLVPYPFMATKTITHPLVDDAAASPQGWPINFTRRAQDVVLFGFSAFTIEDARRACARVLERGDARLKPALGVGGKGQQVVSNMDQANRALDAMDPAGLSVYGICIEENLRNVTTYSVGTVWFGEMRIAYCGTQRLTPDHRNESVYGGSDLLVTRGNFADLLQLAIAPELQSAVEQARVYDLAASTEIAGFLASRRNYDVIAGINGQGHHRGGVLEQSWRIGGATPAEVAALEAFREDPSLNCVRASCPEIYDADHEPPPHAHLSFRGEDPEVGSLIKYSVVEKA